MVSVPNLLEEEFIEAAEVRGEDPEQALQQLMLKYVQNEDATAAELLGEHPDGPASTIGEYNPDDTRELRREAIEGLVGYPGEVEIDPADVPDDEVPRDPGAKRELVLAVLRHEHDRFAEDDERVHENVIRRGDVVRVARMFIDDINESDHKRREYVEKVMDRLLVSPNVEEEQRAFWTVEKALEYIESVRPDDFSDPHTAFIVEMDVADISKEILASSRDDVGVDRVNDARSEWGLKPLDAAEWMVYRDFPESTDE